MRRIDCRMSRAKSVENAIAQDGQLEIKYVQQETIYTGDKYSRYL